MEAQGRGSLHDSGHSRGFGDLGTITELWISAHYHKWLMWMSATTTQAVTVEWWVPTPLPMTWASLSYLLSCAFSLTGPDLPKSRGVREKTEHYKKSAFLSTGNLGMHPCTHPDPKKDPAMAAEMGGLLLV